MMTSPAVESTIVLKNHTCSDISVPSSEPVLDITSVLVSSSVDDSKRQCAICLENFVEGDLITTSSINLECKHQFHQPCIMEWCMKQSDCPCCRRDLLFLYDTATVAMDNIDSSRTDFTRSIPDFPEE
jgi:Ring finger domain